MSEMMILRSKDVIENLRERLARCPMVARYGEEESATLVHAFWDLEESFRKFLDEQLPKLADPSVEGEQLEDLLMDILQEFQHILYHIHDPMFFRVVEPTHEWLAASAQSDKAGTSEPAVPSAPAK